MLATALLVLLLADPRPPQTVVLTSAVGDFDGDGRDDEIQIIMTSGRRYVDDQPWCGMSYGGILKYEGRFIVRVRRRGKRPVDTDLNRLFGNASALWFFGRDWDLYAAEFNHQGRLQFTLGQYGSCASWGYRLFGVGRDGHVSALTPELYNGDRENSTGGVYPTDNGFEVSSVSGWGGPPPVCIAWSWDNATGAFVRAGERPGACEDESSGPQGAP